jgi:plasmid stabilization system protein ParE
MAAGLIWSAEALGDLDAIADYIHRDSPHHARREVDAALDLAGSIVEQPLIGRIVPELDDPNIRERFLYSYRMLYAIAPERIEIVALIHGRRLLESIEDRLG